MTTITLLAKIYNSQQLKQIDTTLEELLGDLSVETTVKGTAANKWVQVELSGEDEAIATKLLEREMGFCPANIANVKKFDVVKGYITHFEKSKEQLVLDIGIFEPTTIYANVALSHLQSHLAEGKKVPLKKLGELWGLCENIPLNIKILEVKPDQNRIEAELQTGQVRKFEQWKDSLLDRLIVTGASRSELNMIIAQEGLNRDVIDVEVLGTFEHALVCKLGTDAAGLIGRIGRRLRKAKFTVFNPKNALSFFELDKTPKVEVKSA
jgi:hypothetical protein